MQILTFLIVTHKIIHRFTCKFSVNSFYTQKSYKSGEPMLYSAKKFESTIKSKNEVHISWGVLSSASVRAFNGPIGMTFWSPTWNRVYSCTCTGVYYVDGRDKILTTSILNCNKKVITVLCEKVVKAYTFPCVPTAFSLYCTHLFACPHSSVLIFYVHYPCARAALGKVCQKEKRKEAELGVRENWVEEKGSKIKSLACSSLWSSHYLKWALYCKDYTKNTPEVLQ